MCVCTCYSKIKGIARIFRNIIQNSFSLLPVNVFIFFKYFILGYCVVV